MTVGILMILMAGYIVGRWHERDKARAVNKAFLDGKAVARQVAKNNRAQRGMEAIPVPGYAEAKWVDHGVEKKAVVSVNEIAKLAVANGRAAGRVQ